jgi:hypothetical protein
VPVINHITQSAYLRKLRVFSPFLLYASALSPLSITTYASYWYLPRYPMLPIAPFLQRFLPYEPHYLKLIVPFFGLRPLTLSHRLNIGTKGRRRLAKVNWSERRKEFAAREIGAEDESGGAERGDS